MRRKLWIPIVGVILFFTLFPIRDPSQVHRRNPWEIAIGRKSGTIVSIGMDGRIMIKRRWPWATRVPRHFSPGKSLDLAKDESVFVTVNENEPGRGRHSIEVLALPDGALVNRIPFPEGRHWHVRISPDGKLIAADLKLTLLSLPEGEPYDWQPPPRGNCLAMAWHPTERKLAAVIYPKQPGKPFPNDEPREFYLYDIDKRSEERLHQDDGSIQRLYFSPDGGRLVYVSTDMRDQSKRIRVLDLATKRMINLHTITRTEKEFVSDSVGIAFLGPDVMVVGHYDSLYVFKQEKLHKLIQSKGRGRPGITAIQAAPDGKTLYYGTDGGRIEKLVVN